MLKINRKYFALVVSLLLLIAAMAGFDGLDDVSANLALFRPGTLLTVAGLFLGTVLLSFVRIWIIFRDFGHDIAFYPVAKACMAGNIGALFFIPVFGQIAGRQIYLEQLGVTAIENSAASGYERVLAGGVSAVFAISGFIYIYDFQLAENTAITDLVMFLVAPLIALVVFVKWIMNEQEKQVLRTLLSWGAIFRLFRVTLIVTAGMILMMLCFAQMFSSILPGADPWQLVSIAFIVSFLASLPISFGGWGLRELSSMFFVAYLGGSAEAGFVASLFIGLISIGIVLLFYPILLLGKGR
ncbi:lysylphosphatidylglycerol synthase domain-containing protein [Thiopseudomonas acetoxidans]|uniref:Lysylphosphatidylglycerol synthase domain-containing protein n=1 Tax=Thiopseudomonas acetoxidans TaxID=3041622 RepID=A0ABT7SQL5_9GAMM|nr:lysylphosphatidylglycerol synthase domain-containing protein [Thiopseudomonas sp. CY1220]MDM7858488.1 lysylphosphatidylglycerol synthase domain-containing protein [Thiopseudomonas sp. CY1220]